MNHSHSYHFYVLLIIFQRIFLFVPQSHMHDLQNENARLHRLLDIFDCQPDFMFTCTEDGRVTHLSHRLAAYRGINTHDESTHVSHLMRQESVEVLYDYINALNRSYSQVNSSKSFFDNHQRDDMVKEVYMLEDATMQRYSLGYMRVSRVNRKPSALVDPDTYNENGAAPIGAATTTSSTKEAVRTGNRSSPSKRQKRDTDSSLISAKSLEDAAAALSALTGMANGTMGSTRSADEDDESASATSGVFATEANVSDIASTFINSTDIYSSRDNSPRGGAATVTGGESRASLSASSSANASSNGLADMGERYSATRRRASASTRAAPAASAAAAASDNGEEASYVGTGAGSVVDAVLPCINEEEYVVVVRPADISMPSQAIRNPAQFGPSLSKASMVKHNSQVKIEGERALGRKRSPSGGSSSGSGDMAFENTSHSSSSAQGSGTSSGFTSKQSNSSGSGSNSDDGVPDNSSNDSHEVLEGK